MASGEKKKKVRLALSPTAEKYARHDAPVKVKLMAARGAIPLDPIDLATLLFALAHDPDPQVKKTAQATLNNLPEKILRAILTGPAHPALLGHLARFHREDQESCEAIALNPATSDLTIAFLASLPIRGVVEIISNNQQRLQRESRILEALGENPLTGRAVLERILTFLGLENSAEEHNSASSELSEEEATQAVHAAIGEQSLEMAVLLGSEEEPAEEESDNIFAAVQKMTVMQKVKLARVGGKEARSLLIKDRNKVVALCAIQSPKITDSEIVAIAQSRSVSDEILRVISSNKDWTRNYQIKLALTSNPKTPLPQAVKFLNYLQDKDLRTLMKSKDVPSSISNYARRILEKKGLV